MLPGPPDSKPPRRGTRAPSLADTLDEADERAQAAAAVIERDVREATAVTAAALVAAELAFPRAKTPADAELAAAIAKIRADQPEWNLAENVARALEALAARVDESERQAAATVAAAAKKRERWVPLWRAVKAGAAATALTLAGFTVNALVNHGDSRRAAAQQAQVPAGLEQAAAIPQPGAGQAGERHQHAQADHAAPTGPAKGLSRPILI